MGKAGGRWPRTPVRPVGWVAAAGRGAGAVLRDPVIVMVAVAVPGAVGVASGWWAAPRAPAGAAPIQVAEAAPIQAGGAAAWAALFVALALLELGAWLLQPTLTRESAAHPTISALLDPVLASHPGRAVGFAAWLALGWFLAGR